MKIATWNVNSLRVRLPHVLQWMETTQPDVLALQETKLQDANFPEATFTAAGYHVIYAGQKTYNGMAIISRIPLTDIVTDFLGDADDPQRRLLAATAGSLRIINVYVPNGASLDSDKYPYKLQWLEKLTQFITNEHQRYPHMVILGDFNIAPEDRDVHDPVLWEGHVLTSVPEREAFQKILTTGMSDAFRLLNQETEYSWWDYRNGAFRRNLGLRIDHILISQALTARCVACYIDKIPRKWSQPSDHAPVMVELDI